MSASQDQMQSMIAAQAAEWFVAHRSGGLTEARREAFMDWLRASPAHTREYLALTGFAADLGQVAQRFSTPADALIAHAQGADDSVHSLYPDKKEKANKDRRLYLAAAAASIIAVLTALWLYQRPDYSTAHAEQRSWRLPDGSTVHLNSDSVVDIRFDKHRRQVDLIRGQAIFQVAKNPARPFLVRAGDTLVQAVGTEFDVYRKPSNSGDTIISVIEGRVAIVQTGLQLAAGEQARISSTGTTVSSKPAAVRKTIAWLQRQVVFERDPLGDVVDEFNRYNDLHIRVTDPALRREEVSGIFSAYDTESFVQFLKRQPGMRIEQQDNEVLVSPAMPPL